MGRGHSDLPAVRRGGQSQRLASAQGLGVQDGAALYDALVDEGWQGQDAFAALAFDLGCASGLLTDEQTQQLKDAVAGAYGAAFAGLAGMTGDE